MSSIDPVTAALLVIGDEILSGRTKDRNIGHLADMMTAVGIDLLEARIVADRRSAIVEAIRDLSARHTYLFTTGGIGPTHDDITAECVAEAVDRPLIEDPRAVALLAAHYESRNLPFTEARRRMTRMPEGSALIENPVSVAPGFIIDNIHVMAGVPSIFQAMLDNVVPTLRTGRKLLSKSVACPLGEGTIGSALAAIQERHPDTMIGSYPKYSDGSFWTELVVRGHDEAAIDDAVAAIHDMLKAQLGGDATVTS